MIICGARSERAEVPTAAYVLDVVRHTNPFHVRATEEFADELAAGCTPSIRAIRARLHVGQSRAQQVRVHLATTVGQVLGRGTAAALDSCQSQHGSRV